MRDTQIQALLIGTESFISKYWSMLVGVQDIVNISILVWVLQIETSIINKVTSVCPRFQRSHLTQEEEDNNNKNHDDTNDKRAHDCLQDENIVKTTNGNNNCSIFPIVS